jgi:hypothetical protein
MIKAILDLPEAHLPTNAATTEAGIKPYPEGQVGFTRRAILGEMVKFSTHLNHRDETIRNNLISMFFGLISHINYSYQDYEHLMRNRKFMITDAKQVDLSHDEEASDFEGIDNSVSVD